MSGGRLRPGSLARPALHFLQVLLDALVDQARDAKRLAARAAIDQRLGAGQDAVEEGVDLVAETVLLLDLVGLVAIAASPSTIGSPRRR